MIVKSSGEKKTIDDAMQICREKRERAMLEDGIKAAAKSKPGADAPKPTPESVAAGQRPEDYISLFCSRKPLPALLRKILNILMSKK